MLPGMVNAHTHSPSSLQRGTTSGLPLDLNLLAALARRTPKSLPHVRAAAQRLAMESLKSGVTALVDHFAFGALPSVEAINTVFSAYADIGIRAAVAAPMSAWHDASCPNARKARSPSGAWTLLVTNPRSPSRKGP